jgi:hypothetical protein
VGAVGKTVQAGSLISLSAGLAAYEQTPAGMEAPRMLRLVDWVGLRTCDAFSLFGAEGLIDSSCSGKAGVFGLGLLTAVILVLFVFFAVTTIKT